MIHHHKLLFSFAREGKEGGRAFCTLTSFLSRLKGEEEEKRASVCTSQVACRRLMKRNKYKREET
jgi:hypothetical protein